MKAHRSYLGIDFGTCNTGCWLVRGRGLTVECIPLQPRSRSLSSVVLWERRGDGQEVVLAVGDEAEQEYGLAPVGRKSAGVWPQTSSLKSPRRKGIEKMHWRSYVN